MLYVIYGTMGETLVYLRSARPKLIVKLKVATALNLNLGLTIKNNVFIVVTY